MGAGTWRHRIRKKCGQEEGPKTWNQNGFQTLLFINQQYPNILLLTVSSWQILRPISCYLHVFFLIFVFESLKCLLFSIMSKFSSGFHRMVAIFKPEGHTKECQNAYIRPVADGFKLIYYPLPDLEVQNYAKTNLQ